MHRSLAVHAVHYHILCMHSVVNLFGAQWGKLILCMQQLLGRRGGTVVPEGLMFYSWFFIF